MMKMKKILSFALALALLFTSVISVSAEGVPSQKEEIVYGILDLDGSVNNLYVVNIFNGGTITDYGTYSDIRNMTTSEKLDQKIDQITINTKADKFYYQGTLAKKELPWNIAIKYFLDDKEISASELAGKSGKLKITMAVKANDKINNSFYNNYALQIALSLDNKLCSNIKAENATVAEAGSKKQLAYTVLPGKGIDIVATADVRDFEMDAITINGIKLSLGITVDSDEFTGQITELAGAIEGLDDGAAELLKGLNQLSSGMQKYIDGMKAFKDGLGQLSNGASQLNTGAAALKNGLSELTKQNDPFINGASAIQQTTFDAVNAQLKGMNLGLPVLTPANYSAVLSAIPDLAAVKKQLDGAVQFTQGLKGYMDGVEQLSKGASDLAKGTGEFNSSAKVISSSANELYYGAVELNGGIQKLRDGLATYKAGTKKLRAGTSNMDSVIDDKVDELLGSISGNGDKVVSFVSEKNTNVSAVQFVLKTNSIEIPETPEIAPVKPAELNLWQKLLKLFGLYK
jgi:X-X-X-Leu-X-X-Gly heptad repeat protein